jgi:hypothetical protein
MTDGRERPQHGDGLVGQVSGGNQDSHRPAVDDHVQCGGGLPVRSLAGAAHDLEATDRLPRPEALDGGLLGVGERPAVRLHAEVERGELGGGGAEAAFHHPHSFEFQFPDISRTVTVLSPSTVSDAKSWTRLMEIQPRPVIGTSRIVGSES